jgi:UDP-glucose 6-dehydrogenase
MPGYSDTVSKKMRDYGYTVSYNPEFIAQGTVLRDQASPDMVSDWRRINRGWRHHAGNV